MEEGMHSVERSYKIEIDVVADLGVAVLGTRDIPADVLKEVVGVISHELRYRQKRIDETLSKIK